MVVVGVVVAVVAVVAVVVVVIFVDCPHLPTSVTASLRALVQAP